MRLVTFLRKRRKDRLGAIVGNQVIDLNAAYRCLLEDRGEPRPEELAEAMVPAGMLGFLDSGERALAAAAEAIAFISRADQITLENRGLCYPLESVILRAPVPRPRKLILLGLNYQDHAEEAKMKIPEVPTLFSKYASSVIGPGEPIRIPKVSHMIDYEGEFAFVIGKQGKDIPREKAMDYVAGYTIMNDVSCRDYQMKTGQWMVGKTFDTFAPMGPCLVLKDEVPDPHNLELALYLNGERMQHSNTKHLIFKIPDLVAFMSQVFTLEPGDVISTGTPSGVGFARKPPVFLKPGDKVRIEITGLGALENPVAAAISSTVRPAPA